MWLFDKIREKKQIREERCSTLLSRIDTALDELKQVFSCPDRFVTDDDITISGYFKIKIRTIKCDEGIIGL